MKKHTTDHLASINSGKVTKTNVIGLRKILNANARRYFGWSVSSVAPNYTPEEVDTLLAALCNKKPRVVGELHDTGLKLLRSPRYRKRLAEVKDIIDNLDHFHLVEFDALGNHGLHHVPVYKACGAGKSFTFRNIPWQSGGDGPEIISY